MAESPFREEMEDFVSSDIEGRPPVPSNSVLLPETGSSLVTTDAVRKPGAVTDAAAQTKEDEEQEEAGPEEAEAVRSRALHMQEWEEAGGKVEIYPKNKIVFDGPFDTVTSVELILTNRSSYRVSFKVKTTRPDHLKIRPGYGFVGSNDTAHVRIKCLPFDRGEVPLRDRCSIICAAVPLNLRGFYRAYDWWRGDSPPALSTQHRQTLNISYSRPDEMAVEKEKRDAETGTSGTSSALEVVEIVEEVEETEGQPELATE